MIKRTIRVLVIEDSTIIQKMVVKMLEGGDHGSFEVVLADNLTDGLQRLQETEVDVVILDLSLPESTGVETVGKVRSVDSNTPIVVFTGTDDEHLAIAAMHLGADDYLVKKEVRQGSLLSRTLHYTVEQKKARIALNQYAIEMERLASARAQQLLHQDRLAIIGTMSAGVAHEIRGPLTYATANVEALQAQWDDLMSLLPELHNRMKDSDDLAYIVEETPGMISDTLMGLKRIGEITEGLKQFSRKENTALVNRCVEDCLEDALTLCTNVLKYGIEIEKDYHTRDLSIPLQPQKLTQVFVNLFYNAAQAMENKGKLTISTQLADSAVKIKIGDSGPGIPEEKLESIFEPFFTTKAVGQGTGLGLSICKEIIHEHGGTITAESTDAGASFQMILPICCDNEIVKETSA